MTTNDPSRFWIFILLILRLKSLRAISRTLDGVAVHLGHRVT